MPGFDGTGPLGTGPLTGKGLGPCGLGLSLGRRFGARWWFRRFFGLRRPATKEEKLAALGEYKKALQEELKDVEKEEQELQKEA